VHLLPENLAPDQAQELPAPIAALLAKRGCQTPEEIRQFLSWDPADLDAALLPATAMKGIDEAVEILSKARWNGETVVVHGDYDVDGMTGTAILYLGLQRAGFQVGWTLPRRDGEGYGLTDASLSRCERGEGIEGDITLKDPKAKWVLSVDTGITAGPEVERARARGLGVIVTDHHLPGEGTFPTAAAAVVNPQQEGCAYPNKGISGAGVAWKLIQALYQRLGTPEGANPNRLLQLVAVATIADMVPLTSENRALVRLGLKEWTERPLPGMRALFQTAGFQAGTAPRLGDISFKIAPRLNSAGRMRRGEVAIRLLTSTSAEHARNLAGQIDALNRERQALDQRITREAQEIAAAESKDGIPVGHVLAGDSWHEGVSGIVAARVAEVHGIPVAILAPDPARPGELRGSARSGGRVDLHHLITGCAHLLERWGGHCHAAGMSIRRENVAEFRSQFLAAAEEALKAPIAPGGLTADVNIPLAQVDHQLMEFLERMEPFGQANPAPLFECAEAELLWISAVGDGGRHLKVRVAQGSAVMEGIAFSQGHLIKSLNTGERVHILFVPGWNEFRGTRTVQLLIKEIK
jgi:single-stranded-DNA-specific exonuclease